MSCTDEKTCKVVAPFREVISQYNGLVKEKTRVEKSVEPLSKQIKELEGLKQAFQNKLETEQKQVKCLKVELAQSKLENREKVLQQLRMEREIADFRKERAQYNGMLQKLWGLLKTTMEQPEANSLEFLREQSPVKKLERLCALLENPQGKLVNRHEKDSDDAISDKDENLEESSQTSSFTQRTFGQTRDTPKFRESAEDTSTDESNSEEGNGLEDAGGKRKRKEQKRDQSRNKRLKKHLTGINNQGPSEDSSELQDGNLAQGSSRDVRHLHYPLTKKTELRCSLFFTKLEECQALFKETDELNDHNWIVHGLVAHYMQCQKCGDVVFGPKMLRQHNKDNHEMDLDSSESESELAEKMEGNSPVKQNCCLFH